jgi:MFS family permease
LEVVPINRSAIRFVILLGFVSLFADMTYESARSITGPYLAILGASAAAVGMTAGLGELFGYGLRIVSGLITDRTRRYWTITIVGYTINVLVVPALALAGNWPVAAVLIVAERLGKAVRTPARDAMLSHATHEVGRGWGFGIHEAMDQIGAMLGPTIVAVILALKGSYQFGLAVLIFPALMALAVLVLARITYPTPQDLEPAFHKGEARGLGRIFWLYLVAIACIAAGFADFPLIAFHLKTGDMVADKWIPLIYAGAMGVDAIAALIFGRLYDKKGLKAVLFAVVLCAWSTPLLFLTGLHWVLVGMVLWGISLGAQESIIRAVVADITPHDRRATSYGLFNGGFGFAWFVGSSLMGILYDRSLVALAAFSVAAQLASLPVLYVVSRRLKGVGI